MKALRKVFMVTAIAVPMLCVPERCSNAGILGDAALLAQQIMQFEQDWSLSQRTWEDLEAKCDKLKNFADKMIKGAEKAGAIMETYRTISTSVNLVKNAKYQFDSYLQYASVFGQNYRIDNCYTSLRSFGTYTASVYRSFKTALSNLSQYTDNSNHFEVAKVLKEIQDECIDSLIEAVDKTSESLFNETQNICLEAINKENQDLIRSLGV